jgi:hydrogenase maturation protein HypF
MALEYKISDELILAPYDYEIIPEKVLSIDWTDIVKGVIADIRGGKNATMISTRFHLTLIKIIIDIAHQANNPNIVLTGGCFQNKWLLENAVNRLKQEGFTPYWHKQIPANDGGISLGQMFVAARRLENVSGNTWKN